MRLVLEVGIVRRSSSFSVEARETINFQRAWKEQGIKEALEVGSLTKGLARLRRHLQNSVTQRVSLAATATAKIKIATMAEKRHREGNTILKMEESMPRPYPDITYPT
jgi:hypothetical protein